MLVNKGKCLELYLVKEICDLEGNIVKKVKFKILNIVNYEDRYWCII